MSDHWDRALLRSPSIYEIDDLETAAYRLVAEQVIYRSDKLSRTAYGAIEKYERDMQEALAPLGLLVKVNRKAQYAYALPVRAKAGNATKNQTLLALVLRKLYDVGASEGRFNDDREIICDLVELGETYRLATQRELPAKGELRALLLTMKRWGLIRLVEDEAEFEGAAGDQPYQVAIRPGIVDVLGETALARLAEWAPRDEDDNVLGLKEDEEELES